MPLVRSQRDEFHHIDPDPGVTSIERWRVSTSCSRRSSDLRSSLKPTSRNPRFASKTASWTTAAHHVVRLERVQEDEEDDGHSTYLPGLPQIPMETNVSGFLCIDRPVLTACTPGSNRCGEYSAYVGHGWPSINSLHQAHPVILNSPTHDLANPFPFTFEDPEASDVFPCHYHS